MSTSLNPNSRGLVLGALVDFMTHLNQMEAPIVIGMDYPQDRLLDAFTEWAASRNISLKTIDKPLWIEACRHGVFKDESP